MEPILSSVKKNAEQHRSGKSKGSKAELPSNREEFFSAIATPKKRRVPRH